MSHGVLQMTLHDRLDDITNQGSASHGRRANAPRNSPLCIVRYLAQRTAVRRILGHVLIYVGRQCRHCLICRNGCSAGRPFRPLLRTGHFLQAKTIWSRRHKGLISTRPTYVTVEHSKRMRQRQQMQRGCERFVPRPIPYHFVAAPVRQKSNFLFGPATNPLARPTNKKELIFLLVSFPHPALASVV